MSKTSPRACSKPCAKLSACFSALLFAAVPAANAAPCVDGEANLPEISRPEVGSGFHPKPAVAAVRHLAVAADPRAAAAARAVLRSGGSAIDAAIAAQLVLSVVEPQSSGPGGGGFMMVWDGQRMHAYDGRETAPAAVDANLFMRDGKPLDFASAVVGGRSVGVPGLLRMFELAHRRHGRLDWATLFGPAIALAEGGFVISQRVHTLLDRDRFLRDDPAARALFYGADGKPVAAGTRLRNPALAATLQALAEHGADALYTGPLAERIVDRVRTDARQPGLLSADDLRAYQAKEREPVCTTYRQRYTVCGMPPPSSGGIAVAQMLGILENRPRSTDLGQRLHDFAEAGRLAFADRDRYVADPDFVPLPGGDWRPLVDRAYLIGRAALIGETAMAKALPGQPAGAAALAKLASADDPEVLSTTHLSVVDGDGRAVALTASNESSFGARIMVGGFVLNNELTDFSFNPVADGMQVANRVAPGKRPRSSMAPTIVLDEGVVRLVVGSAGGPNIIGYVAKTIVATLDWGYPLDAALTMPNFGSRNGPTEVESCRTPRRWIESLRARGHTIKPRELVSGTHAILRTPPGQRTVWTGMADPRREGDALGD